METQHSEHIVMKRTGVPGDIGQRRPFLAVRSLSKVPGNSGKHVKTLVNAFRNNSMYLYYI